MRFGERKMWTPKVPERKGDVYFSEKSSDLTPLFKNHAYFHEGKRKGGQRERDLRMPSNPLGASFWRSRAMQRSGRVCDRDSPTLSNLTRPQLRTSGLGSSLVFDTIFAIFCLTAVGDVWKLALCVSHGRVRPLTDGSVWTAAPRMEVEKEENGSDAFEPRASRFRFVGVILTNAISCLFSLFECAHVVFLCSLVA